MSPSVTVSDFRCVSVFGPHRVLADHGTLHILWKPWPTGFRSIPKCFFQCVFSKVYFYRTQVNLGSDLWVRLSVTERPFVDLTDVTLADYLVIEITCWWVTPGILEQHSWWHVTNRISWRLSTSLGCRVCVNVEALVAHVSWQRNFQAWFNEGPITVFHWLLVATPY